MKKKILMLWIVGTLSFGLLACGNSDARTPAQNTEQETWETIPESTQKQDPEETRQSEEESQTTESTVAEKEGSESASEEKMKQDLVAEYEDNFSVDNEAVVAYARKIKEAVANRDMEALADLASYPLYVGFTDGGVSVTSAEELIALGEEKIFTVQMEESIKNADENSLSPSMAGFALSTNGRPNMIFGVVDGRLAIQGINY